MAHFRADFSTCPANMLNSSMFITVIRDLEKGGRAFIDAVVLPSAHTAQALGAGRYPRLSGLMMTVWAFMEIFALGLTPVNRI